MAYTALLQYTLTCWYYYTIFSTMITMTYTTLLQRSLTWTYYAIGRWQAITMTCIVQLKHTVSRSRVLNLIKRLINRIDPVLKFQNWSERFWHQTPRRQGPKTRSFGPENGGLLWQDGEISQRFQRFIADFSTVAWGAERYSSNTFQCLFNSLWRVFSRVSLGCC